jgi:hypothetical protein
MKNFIAIVPISQYPIYKCIDLILMKFRTVEIRVLTTATRAIKR